MKFPQPHTTSYYAATVGDDLRFEPLRGDHRADVCIVGAGFTGVSTAIELAERGYRVHVVEANRVGWGASGRNGGQMISGISGEKRIAKHHGRDVEELFGELRWEGHRIIRNRVEKFGIDCELKSGYVDVAIKPRHLRSFEADHRRLEAARFPYEFRILSREETREALGTDAYIGAMQNMGNGHLHPLKLCVGEVRAAAGLGVVISESSPVTDVVHGENPVVRTSEGSVTADAVVLAGNAYHELDRRLQDILFPVNSFIIATKPLTGDLLASVIPRDYAVCDPNYVIEYFRLSADKRLLFGGRCNYFGSDPAVIAGQLRPRMARVFPQLAGIGIEYAWGGSIGVPLNRVPQLGRLAANIYYCQGYSGHGVNVTHIAGRIMADAVAGTLEDFDLFADVSPILIPGVRHLQRPLISLGIMYYRIMDRL